ncbi:MAG TPA: hypothetical protein ENH23_04145 [candidate division Zixibacteria bacterium]|nr:hypothetical protein [candidate division Zixibacteria bacterium]
MFTKRKSSMGISYFGAHTPGKEFKNSIENGDTITLHIEKESVYVKNILRLSDNNFSGKVLGFEPSFSLEFNGVKIGDKVNFNEEHIITCSSN